MQPLGAQQTLRPCWTRHDCTFIHDHSPETSRPDLASSAMPAKPRHGLDKSLDTSDSTAEDQSCGTMSASTGALIRFQGLQALTVNVALSFVRLRDEQIRHVPSNVVFVAHGVATKDLLQSAIRSASPSPSNRSRTYILAFTSARSQFCLLIMEIISGATLPSSFSLPT